MVSFFLQVQNVEKLQYVEGIVCGGKTYRRVKVRTLERLFPIINILVMLFR